MSFSGLSKYLLPVRYWRRVLVLVNKVILMPLDIFMAPAYKATFKYPPVFFLGAPRSGSTLIYQVVTDAFDVDYLSNRHCQLFGMPGLIARFFNPIRKKAPSDYTSYHGLTSGAAAPSECGEWWYRFFPRNPAYVTLDDVDVKKMRKFRRSLLALTKASGKPVIFKNLYVSLRLEVIAKYVPEALFVIIKRDELDNAHSILDSRMKVLGRYDQWWSVPPPNVEQLKLLGSAQQAVEQIRAIHNVIKQPVDSNLIDNDRIFTLQYEKFCDDVHASMNELEQFFLKHGMTASRRFSVPGKFSINRDIRIDKKLYSELQAITENQ